MTEIHQHTHKFDAVGLEVQLPTAPIELQVRHTYRIDDDTKEWLNDRMGKLMLFAAGVFVFVGTTAYLILK